MSSEVSHPSVSDATPATGNSRRTLVRRIAFGAAGIGIVLLSAAVGWFLQGALHPRTGDSTASQTTDPGTRVESKVEETGGGHLHSEHPVAGEDVAHAAAGDGAAPTMDANGPAGPIIAEKRSADGHADHAGSESDHDSATLSTDEATPDFEGDLTRVEANGEQFLIEGDAVHALREFDRVVSQKDRAQDDVLHYRCGICAEALGNRDRALSEYATALGAAHDESLITLCRLGQARIWRKLGHTDMSLQLLAAAWLTNGHSQRASVLRPFTAYLLADSLAAAGVAAEKSDLAADDGLKYPTWEFELFDPALLYYIRSDATPETGNEPGVHMVAASADNSTDGAIQANLPRIGVINVVEALCRAAGFQAEWSAAARVAVSSRSAEVCLANGNLAMCLDMLTTPLDVAWTQEEQKIRLWTEDEVAAPTLANLRRSAARRAMEHAAQQHAEFPLSAQALIVLGNLAQREGRFDVAERMYQSMLEQQPLSPVRSDAWFNLGKLYLGSNRLDAALDAFWHVIDCGAPPATSGTAYLYVGRLLLDMEQPRRAIAPLIRAAQLAVDTNLRTKSVFSLAAAYLLYDSPAAANEAMMDFRSDVESQSLQAAFLSALARYRAAEDPARRLYEAEALLSAADAVKASDFFGRYGWYLRGSAYQELLLPEIAAGIYREALDSPTPPPYRDAVAFGLATSLLDTGDVAGGRARLVEVMQHAQSSWRWRAGFRLCRLLIEAKETQAAASTARMLVEECTSRDDKTQALQMLGAAYQQLGDHASAALCFAGSLPDAASSNVSKEP